MMAITPPIPRHAVATITSTSSLARLPIWFLFKSATTTTMTAETIALTSAIRPRDLFAASLIFLAGPYLSGWLTRDVHLRNVGGQPGMVGAFLLGFAFAFGWTPCIGPILGSVLLIAAAQETKMQGVLLLVVYSAGLAIPFLVTALGVSQFMNFYQRFRKHLHAVEVLSGVLLLVVGSLIFTNHFTWLSGKLGFLQQFAR